MDLTTILIGVLGTIGSLWLTGIQLQVRKMENKVSRTMSKEEIRELLADKLEVNTARLLDLKEDLKIIEEKLDKLAGK